jgi:hypothetical protein
MERARGKDWIKEKKEEIIFPGNFDGSCTSK